jgi:hypothetical protein
MKTNHGIRAARALFGAGLALAACSTGPRTARPELSARADPHLLVNGHAVPANERFLFDILVARESAHRIGVGVPVSEQPLVLVDGVRISRGIQALASFPASHVQDVEVLHRTEAAARYGSQARHGAIVVRTR